MTVLLVDDVAELRSVVRQALRLDGSFEVVAEASNGTDAIELARRHQPDLVVLDLGLPDRAGHEVLAGVRDVAPRALVVVFSGSYVADHNSVVGRADAFVAKQQQVDELVRELVHVSAQTRQNALIELSEEPSEAAVARAFVEERCEAWGCPALVETAQLVASELVTNAIVHARSACELRAVLVGDSLRLEVTDYDASGSPDVQAPDENDTHGRGLLIVDALARSWGVVPRNGLGKTVWAVLAH